ncbi:Alpha-mannosidase [Pseudomonas syringae pv. actinidiae]|uniref:Alpha-mannosidase n=1 Tax=Pseudomonas syringae pv. actinidiae TaxID=103796 RepID=A0AAN4QFR8_PSESF|nr:Alpha-mannosidase [Pseudomonas syringae pv. actinidiae]
MGKGKPKKRRGFGSFDCSIRTLLQVLPDTARLQAADSRLRGGVWKGFENAGLSAGGAGVMTTCKGSQSARHFAQIIYH